jgi:hypothetical protein
VAFRLPGTAYGPAKAQEIDRRGDVSLGMLRTTIRRFEITPEPGVEVVAVPDPVELDMGWGAFTRSVQKKKDGSLVIEDKKEIRKRRLEVGRYQEFVDFKRRLQKAGRQRVIFELPDPKKT